MKITVFDTTPEKLGHELKDFFSDYGNFEIMHMVQSESFYPAKINPVTHVTLTVVWRPLD